MKKLKVSREKVLSISGMVTILAFGLASIAYGEGNSWAQNLKSWVLDGVNAILVCVIAAFSIKFIAKRQFVQFIGFIILAAFVSVIALGPDKLQTLGSTMWGIIFK